MAVNMFLKFENPAIKGSSTAPGHTDEIEVLSWSHGFVQPTSPTRGGGTVESATHQSLTFTKYLDHATDDLLKLCWAGKQIGKATLSCYRADGASDNKPVEYLRLVMEHVIISNYSISGGPGDIPVENVALDYGIIQYTYVDQKHGDSSAKHDLRTHAVT
jgi:type VI secretion system secreted protein Hcp